MTFKVGDSVVLVKAYCLDNVGKRLKLVAKLPAGFDNTNAELGPRWAVSPSLPRAGGGYICHVPESGLAKIVCYSIY